MSILSMKKFVTTLICLGSDFADDYSPHGSLVGDYFPDTDHSDNELGEVLHYLSQLSRELGASI